MIRKEAGRGRQRQAEASNKGVVFKSGRMAVEEYPPTFQKRAEKVMILMTIRGLYAGDKGRPRQRQAEAGKGRQRQATRAYF